MPRVCRYSMWTLLLMILAAGIASPDPKDFVYVAGRIKRTFDLALPTLPQSVQSHYAVRMYRVSGDTLYLPYVLADCGAVARKLQMDLDSVGDSAYCGRRTDELLRGLIGDNRKTRMRRELFSERPRVLIDLEILHNTSKLVDYGLADSVSLQLAGRARTYLRQVDFATFLLDPEVIRVYSAQAVNFIYYLLSLDLGDLRARYRQAFLEAFPDKQDGELSDLQFSDKVYGLTHFILAASDYYQHPVDSNEFAWILSYFEREKDRILWETKPDIIAETGLCFLLSGKADHGLVRKCRESVASAFDKKVGLIRAPSGSTDLTQGEHRNVLAIMLLQWPARLLWGPHFAAPAQVRDSSQSYLISSPRRASALIV